MRYFKIICRPGSNSQPFNSTFSHINKLFKKAKSSDDLISYFVTLKHSTDFDYKHEIISLNEYQLLDRIIVEEFVKKVVDFL